MQPPHRPDLGVPGVEQPTLRGPYRRTGTVGHPGVPDPAQYTDVAQPAAGLLQFAFEQEREFPVRRPPLGGQLPQGHQGGGCVAAPAGRHGLAQPPGQRRVAGYQPGVEQPERGLGVLPGHRDRLVERAHRVVQREFGIPDRVPDPRCERLHIGQSTVEQDQVEVAARGALAPAQPADRDQRYAGYPRQQCGEPGVQRVRAFPAGPLPDARGQHGAGGPTSRRHHRYRVLRHWSVRARQARARRYAPGPPRRPG